MSRSSRPEPSWILKDQGSFASIHVKLPPGTLVNCESDAVVTFSQTVEVRGVMAGGFLGALARAFLTRESFFTTVVENAGQSGVADVMMAPSQPGGIVLHRLTETERRIAGDSDMGYGDLLLTSGAYIASDSNVKISSEVQARIGNSLLSGTGFFLLRASGRGYVACGAYGSVHKYILTPGEVRAVDNGHLVAWSASMNYWVGLASVGRRGTGRNLMHSMTSGEGLMCHFTGPGVIYLQSHKADESVATNGRSKTSNGPSQPASCLSILFSIVVLFSFLCVFAYVASQAREIAMEANEYVDKYGARPRRNRRAQHEGYRQEEF